MNIDELGQTLKEIKERLSLIEPKKKRVIKAPPSQKQIEHRKKFAEQAKLKSQQAKETKNIEEPINDNDKKPAKKIKTKK